MKAARTLKARLQVPEKRFSETGAQRQLGLYSRCIDGDAQSVEEFERLITSGKAIPSWRTCSSYFVQAPPPCK